MTKTRKQKKTKGQKKERFVAKLAQNLGVANLLTQRQSRRKYYWQAHTGWMMALILTVVFLATRFSASATYFITTIPVGSFPASAGVNPNTNQIYVANNLANTVSVISGKNYSVIATIPTGSAPDEVAVNLTTNLVYVTNEFSNTVSVISGTANSIVATIPVGPSPGGIGVNPITNLIYVASFENATVAVISGTTNQIIANVPVGFRAVEIAVNPLTNFIYVTNTQDNTVSVINGASNSVVATIGVGPYPVGIGVNPLTNLIYVANRNSNYVSVINGSSNALVATTTVGSGPIGIGVNPAKNLIYVANIDSDSVSVIDGSTNSVVTTTAVGSRPFGVGVNSNTNQVYVTNVNSNDVSVLGETYPSTTSLNSSPNPSVYNQSVSFTATVMPITATGTITFNFDNTSPVTTTLINGSASYITNTLDVGQHHIKATYNGNNVLDESTSAPVTQSVRAGPPAQIRPVAGSGQSSAISTTFNSKLVAEVTDAFDNPVDSLHNNFSA